MEEGGGGKKGRLGARGRAEERGAGAREGRRRQRRRAGRVRGTGEAKGTRGAMKGWGVDEGGPGRGRRREGVGPKSTPLNKHLRHDESKKQTQKQANKEQAIQPTVRSLKRRWKYTSSASRLEREARQTDRQTVWQGGTHRSLATSKTQTQTASQVDQSSGQEDNDDKKRRKKIKILVWYT